MVGTPDERFGSKVIAVVTPRPGQSLDLESLRNEAREYIAGYKLPRELHLVPEIPRAPSGKPLYPKALELVSSGEYRQD